MSDDVCGKPAPVGFGACGLFAPHPKFCHRLLRIDHPKDVATKYRRIEWDDSGKCWEWVSYRVGNGHARKKIGLAAGAEEIP